jgi:hypothetical protein
MPLEKNKEKSEKFILNSLLEPWPINCRIFSEMDHFMNRRPKESLIQMINEDARHAFRKYYILFQQVHAFMIATGPIMKP